MISNNYRWLSSRTRISFLLLFVGFSLIACSLQDVVSFLPINRTPTKANTSARRTPKATESTNLDLNVTARQIIEGVNEARTQRGMASLRVEGSLMLIANDRSTDMIARNYFSHYDPQTGKEPFARYLQTRNYAYHYAGENIAEIKNEVRWIPSLFTVAARYDSTALTKEFVQGWLNSPEHRENILGTHYRRTGVALGVSEDGRRIVATQAFSD